MKLGKQALHWWRDTRGVSTIELALVTPVLCLFLAGMVDLAQGFSAKLALEQAAGRTIELATAPGQVRPSYDYLKAEAMAASGRPESDVIIANWLECDGVRQPQFDGACGDGQQIARYVSVRITSAFKPLLQWQGLWGNRSIDGIPIGGDATVRVQ